MIIFLMENNPLLLLLFLYSASSHILKSRQFKFILECDNISYIRLLYKNIGGVEHEMV